MTHTISVIIPIYNRLEVLPAVLNSILTQTIPVREVILIDDGSTEHTPADVAALLDKNAWGDRVRYIRQENQGQSVALNAGITLAKGEWFAFNGSDDLWLPQKLEWQLKALEAHRDDCDLCFTDAWFMNNPHMKAGVFERSGRRLEGATGRVDDPVSVVVGAHPVWVQTVVAKAETVRAAGGFDPHLRYSEDHDFVFRMALRTKFCYVGMPMVLIDRAPADLRHGGESKKWHDVEFRLRMDQYRFEKQLRLSDDKPDDVRKRIRANLRDAHSHWATCYLRSRDFQQAKKEIRTAATYSLSAGVASKAVLLHLMPRIARKLFLAREQSGPPRYDRTSWRAV